MGRWAYFSTGVEYKFAFAAQSSEAILRLTSDVHIESDVGNWMAMIEVETDENLKTKMQEDLDTLVMRFGTGGGEDDEDFMLDLATMNQLLEEETNYWASDVTYWQWNAEFPKDRIHQLLETYRNEWDRLVSSECPEFQTPSSDSRMAAYDAFMKQQYTAIFADADTSGDGKGEALWDLFLLGSIVFQLKFMLEDDESLGVHWEW